MFADFLFCFQPDPDLRAGDFAAEDGSDGVAGMGDVHGGALCGGVLHIFEFRLRAVCARAGRALAIALMHLNIFHKLVGIFARDGPDERRAVVGVGVDAVHAR